MGKKDIVHDFRSIFSSLCLHPSALGALNYSDIKYSKQKAILYLHLYYFYYVWSFRNLINNTIVTTTILNVPYQPPVPPHRPSTWYLISLPQVLPGVCPNNFHRFSLLSALCLSVISLSIYLFLYLSSCPPFQHFATSVAVQHFFWLIFRVCNNAASALSGSSHLSISLTASSTYTVTDFWLKLFFLGFSLCILIPQEPSLSMLLLSTLPLPCLIYLLHPLISCTTNGFLGALTTHNEFYSIQIMKVYCLFWEGVWGAGVHRPFRASTCIDFSPNSYLYFPRGAWGARVHRPFRPSTFIVPDMLFLPTGCMGCMEGLGCTYYRCLF